MLRYLRSLYIAIIQSHARFIFNPCICNLCRLLSLWIKDKTCVFWPLLSLRRCVDFCGLYISVTILILVSSSRAHLNMDATVFRFVICRPLLEAKQRGSMDILGCTIHHTKEAVATSTLLKFANLLAPQKCSQNNAVRIMWNGNGNQKCQSEISGQNNVNGNQKCRQK